jgi:hypothetical protein
MRRPRHAHKTSVRRAEDMGPLGEENDIKTDNKATEFENVDWIRLAQDWFNGGHHRTQ